MSVKIVAKRAGVARIDAGKESLTITFTGHAAISPDKVMALLKKNKGRIKLIPEYTLQVIAVRRDAPNRVGSGEKVLAGTFLVCYNTMHCTSRNHI